MTEKQEEHDRVMLSAFEQGSDQRNDKIFDVIGDSIIIVIKGQSIISANFK